jgi:chromosome segregation ATPase
LDEVNSDVVRTRVWLESDRRVYWEKQARRCALKLEEAKQSVFSAEMSNLRESTAAERMAVTKAQRELTQAETKLAEVKKWNMDFDSRMAPLVKQLERLQSFLANGLPQAAAYLGQAIKTLDEYANIAAPTSDRSGESLVPTTAGDKTVPAPVGVKKEVS